MKDGHIRRDFVERAGRVERTIVGGEGDQLMGGVSNEFGETLAEKIGFAEIRPAHAGGKIDHDGDRSRLGVIPEGAEGRGRQEERAGGDQSG